MVTSVMNTKGHKKLMVRVVMGSNTFFEGGEKSLTLLPSSFTSI